MIDLNFLNALKYLAVLAGLVLIVIGVIYLSVECQSLPGFLGPTAGDASPRTGLGIGVLLVAALSLGIGALAWRSGRTGQ